MLRTIKTLSSRATHVIDETLNRILIWFKIDPSNRSLPLAQKTFRTMVALNTTLLFAPLIALPLIYLFTAIENTTGSWVHPVLTPFFDLFNSFITPYILLFQYGYLFEGLIAFIIAPITFYLNTKLFRRLKKENPALLSLLKKYLIVSTISGAAVLVSISNIQYGFITGIVFMLLVFGLNVIYLGPSLAGFSIPIYHFLHNLFLLIFVGNLKVMAPILAILISFLAISLFNVALFRFIILLQSDIKEGI